MAELQKQYDKEDPVVKQILQDLELGVWEKDAGPLAGISEATYFNWKKQWPDFREDCRKAVLNYKRKLIQAVNIGAVKDGRVAIETLRTRWPAEWNTAKKIAIVDPQTELQNTIKLLKGELSDEEIAGMEVIDGEVVDDGADNSEPVPDNQAGITEEPKPEV